MSISSKLPLASQLGFSPEETGEETPIPEARREEQFQEAAFDSTQVQDLARNSLDFLAGLAMPTVFRYCFPAVYRQIWALLLGYVFKERDFSQIAIGLPRGFAKTTFVKIFLLFVILFTKKTFILVCANNQEKANAIVSDVMDFLNEDNIKKVFGNWELGAETDNQKLKKFGFRGRNIVIAAGTIETVRGLNLKHQRPDIMLFDDIQNKIEAQSQLVSMQIESEMYGTAMKAKSPHGCLFLFIGNMYPTQWSLLRRIKSNPTWIKFIAGGIIINSQTGAPESLWEELQPLEQLLTEFSNDLASGRPEVFYAEVLNDENAAVNTLFDVEKLVTNPFEEDTQHQGNFIIIDPSNDKANSDAVSIGYFEIFDSKPVCKEISEGRFSPGDSIEESLRLCFKYNCALVAVESNAYQYSHLYWFNFICAQKGIQGINCVDIYSGSRSKNSRILEMFKGLMAQEQYLANAVRSQVISQITSFNHLKTNNVDGILDLLTYSSKVIELYGEFIYSHLTLELQEFQQIQVRGELETTSF